MNRKIFFIITVFILLLSVTAGARTYKIATVGWAGWSPLHVAEINGFWKNYGIDVVVVNYDDPIIILEAAKAGKIDLAMDMAGSLVGIFMSGEPVVALAETNWSHGGDKIIIQNGHTLDEYKNQPLGVFLNLPSSLFFLNCYLETRDLGVADFRIVEIHPDNLSAQFIAGRIPAILNYEPWAAMAVEQGNGQVLASSADFPGCIPECIWAYQQQLKTIPEEDIQHLLRGWLAAVDWIHQPENQGAYFEILNRRTFQGLPDYSQEKLAKMIREVKIHTRAELAHRNRTGGGFEAYLNRLREFLKTTGRLEKNFQPTEIFNNRYIMAVLSD